MEPVVGSRATEDVRHYNDQNRTDYGLQMAKAGFVTFSVDWLGQGHLDDRRRPLHRRVWPGDPCEYFYLAATMLGMTSLGVNMAIGRALIDFVTTLPFVDADRLGVMGLSYGGTLSVWTALTDDRIRAASVICYSDMFADFGYRDADFCGSQVTPSLFDLVDVPELHGLIAPRPLLVEIGARDEIFLIEPAMKCFERVSRIYEHAGASSNLALDLFEGGHEWHGAQSIPFFEQFLGGSA